MTTLKLVDRMAAMPDPGGVRTLGELIERLQSLKIWADDPSYDVITERINVGWTGAGRPAAELARRSTVAGPRETGTRPVTTSGGPWSATPALACRRPARYAPSSPRTTPDRIADSAALEAWYQGWPPRFGQSHGR